MTPEIEIALLIGKALLKYGPGAARDIRDLFSKTAPTLADWDVIFTRAEKSYDDYVKAPAVAPA